MTRKKRERAKTKVALAPTRRTTLWIAMALFVIAALPFVRTLIHDFINLDDTLYITENEPVQQGLTWGNIGWAFTSFHAFNWHPVTWISHMLDVELWGMRAGGHHATNIVFHALNAMLVFLVLRRLTGVIWRSALVAALFAVHPLRVESVAWIAERRDVLSTFFGLLAIWCYASYAVKPSWQRYAAVMLLFALSLMSKPMLVTLPMVLLLLDYWPLARLKPTIDSVMRMVLEKLPLLALSLTSSVITIKAQTDAIDVIGVTLPQRVANAIVSYGAYLWNTVYPNHLAVVYPFEEQWPAWKVIASALALIAITALALLAARIHRAFIVGWLWFLGTLVPVSGLVQIGVAAYADRYTYVPHIGLFLMMVWSVPAKVFTRTWFHALAAMIVAALAVRTYLQSGYWRDSITLFSRTLAITEKNSLAHLNYGSALRKAGQRDESLRQFEMGININPNSALLHENLGNTLSELGEHDRAIFHLQQANQIDPTIARRYNNFAVALLRANRPGEAEQAYREAIRLRPDYVRAHIGLALLLQSANRIDEAITQYRTALQFDPSDVDANVNLGMVLATQRQFAEAIQHYERALAMRPEAAETRLRMGAAHAANGNLDAAITQFQRVLRDHPEHPAARQMFNEAMAQKNSP